MMHYNSIIKKLIPNKQRSTLRYAIVDCAATEDDDIILSKIISDDIEKYSLFTGEDAWTMDHVAPYLLPLSNQPDLEQWLVEKGWGHGWGIFFTSDADSNTLISHFRQYLELQAENGRDIYFRFYDPLILSDFIPLLSEQEALTFFGPVTRFVAENAQGEAVVFDRPGGRVREEISPAKLVLGGNKKALLSERWQARLLPQHVQAFQNLGFKVIPDTDANALSIEDKAGIKANIKKTGSGVETTTGEKRVFKYELTACKNPTKITDPAGNSIHFDIQERDNKEKQNLPPVLNAIRMESGRKTWVFDYDESNHLQRIDFPDATYSHLSYDGYGKLTSLIDRNGNSSHFEYDFDQRITSMQDTNGHQTRFDYNDLTAPSTITFADGAAFNFEYTDAGALKKFIAGNTAVADYEVDPQSGTWKVNYTNGTWAEFEMQNDKIVRASNPNGTVTLEYDSDGHLTKETFGGRTVIYHRSETGQLTGITTPFGQTIHYERDKEDRINSIDAWSGQRIDIQYALNGALKSITYPNGTCLEQKTTAEGLPSQIHLKGKQGTIFYKKFTRDRLNRITQISDASQNIRYTYDKEGHLLKVNDADPGIEDQSFTIDTKANRLSDGHTRYKINNADRLVEVGTTPIKYDGIGNLHQGVCPRGEADFTFTDLNRLKSISLKNGEAHYLYDAFGRRIAKRFKNTTTRFYWAGAQLLHEVCTNDQYGKKTTQTTDYLFFPETPVLLSIRQEDKTYWTAFGHRYEVLCLTDNQSQLVWQAQYDAFGTAHIELGKEIHQPFRLAGQYRDQESGLHYNLARYYDPGQGRFISLDPLFLEGGSDNFYTYCKGDPINYIDPTGEFIFCAMLVGAAIGAAIGGVVEGVRQKQSGEELDGFKIAKAALIGGAIGAIGGGAGAAIEAAVAAGALGTTMAASTLPAMASVGFLSGAGASLAEQCAEARITGNTITPMNMAGQALLDGSVGAVLAPLTAGVGGFLARKLRKAPSLVKPNMLDDNVDDLISNKPKKVSHSDEALEAGQKNNDHLEKSCDADPVNSVTGEVVLTQTDFELPGRIPLTWTRQYGSQNDYSGLLGKGWQTPADARLEIDGKDLVLFHDGNRGAAVFDGLPEKEPLMEVVNGAMLSTGHDHYLVRIKSGLTYHFPKSFNKNRSYVARITDTGGNSLTFTREDGNLTGIRTGSGQNIQVFCKTGRIVAMIYQDKQLAAYRYNGDQLIAAADAQGMHKQFFYKNGLLTRHMNKNKLSFYYEYDNNGRCNRAWGDNGLYDYRFDHRPYESCVHVTDSLGHKKTYHYNKNRVPIKEQDSTGASVTYEYDQKGRVLKLTDPLDRSTEYEYDEAGNVTGIIRPDENRQAFVYDDNNRLVQMLDPNGKIWQQQYDHLGRLTAKTTPLGETTQYTYNAQGDLETVTNPQGQATAFEYDRHGRVSSVALDGKTTRYQRDLMGNITATIDPAGRTTRYAYDENSRLTGIIQPSGKSQSFEWDPENNLILHTDPGGRETRFEYGGVNEIVKRINADGTIVKYQYDTEENLVGVTNEKEQTYRFQYDHAGRVISQSDYWGHTTRYQYDPAGQLIRSIDPLQRVIQYQYDTTGRLLTKTFENEEQEYFNWDANGNLIAIQNKDALVERFFDDANRLIEEKKGDFSVQYQYDANGRRTQRATSFGNTVKYSYDHAGAVSAIKINDQVPVTIERNKTGQITKEQISEYLERSSQYNEDDRLAGQIITSNITNIERNYEYDGSGNLIAKQDSAKGPWRFSYDPMGRITQALDPEHQVERFAYDPAGDLLEHLPDIGHGMRCAKHDHTVYQYDAAGNLAERQNQDTHTRYIWDEQNRLKTVLNKEGDTRITMGYDALGRRWNKKVNGETTTFAWDGDALLSEQFDESPIKEYVYYPGTFEPLAVIDDGNVYYYHNDLNGLPQELTKPTGEIVWSATYDAMGRVDKILVDEVEQPLRLLGQYFDKETDLCYNRYRYYDPQTCSFISQDPLGLAAGENFYAYAANPWTWVDPLGLACREAHQYHSNKEVSLPENQYNLSDAVQFRIANKQFIEQLNSDQAFRKNMLKKNPGLLEWMKDGSKHSNSPPGFTWHHDETPGVLKLVHRADHGANHAVYHPTGKGGRDIWGGGSLGRKGKLNPDGTLKD